MISYSFVDFEVLKIYLNKHDRNFDGESKIAHFRPS